MEINAPNPRTKLRATMARRAGSRDLNNESLNYDAEPEPNMRLSRAIAVVLILHIVAIGGVLAFSLIKDRAPQPSLKTKPAVSTPAATPATVANANIAVAAAAPKRSEAAGAPAERVLAPAALSANATPAAKPVKTTPYTVRTGDTLARVASENSVSLGSLIAANDARVTTTSLKPGQEIQIPAASAPKDRALAEATRLIEAGGATTPAKQTQVTPKAVMPTTIVGKPSASSLPAPTLIAKSTSSTPTPLPAKISPTTPALEKPSAPTPRI